MWMEGSEKKRVKGCKEGGGGQGKRPEALLVTFKGLLSGRGGGWEYRLEGLDAPRRLLSSFHRPPFFWYFRFSAFIVDQNRFLFVWSHAPLILVLVLLLLLPSLSLEFLSL